MADREKGGVTKIERWRESAVCIYSRKVKTAARTAAAAPAGLMKPPALVATWEAVGDGPPRDVVKLLAWLVGMEPAEVEHDVVVKLVPYRVTTVSLPPWPWWAAVVLVSTLLVVELAATEDEEMAEGADDDVVGLAVSRVRAPVTL